MRVWLWGALPLLFCCSPDKQGGECATGADCPTSVPRCVFDQKLGGPRQSYCTAECSFDADCPDDQTCVSQDGLQLCIDRLRVCTDSDPVNGLDDNCDGVLDTDGEISGCNEDAACGAMVCRAPAGDASTVCAPPNPTQTANFSDCQNGSQCRNGLCIAGFCSPLCRSDRTVCPVIRDSDGLERGTVCAEGIDGEARPSFNTCQLDCFERGCPQGTECVARRVLGPGSERLRFVCSTLDEGRLPLGAACSGATVEGNGSCQHGLCRNFLCTRQCSIGDSCSDVGGSTVCREASLTSSEFRAFVCEVP